MARETGLEPATSGVTGRRSNQLSYSRVTRICPRGTRGDLKAGHGEVKDVAFTGSKRLLEPGGDRIATAWTGASGLRINQWCYKLHRQFPGTIGLTVGSRAFQNARLQKKFKKDADAALAAAHQAYGNGRLADVETLCRRILDVLPDHFDTLHLLGVCLSSDPKRLVEAEQVLRAAIAVSPRAANVYCDLGTVLFDLKRF